MKTRHIVLWSSLFMAGVNLEPAAVLASSMTDDFVQKASIGNQFEIVSSQLALQRSQNDAVKQFAQQMIDDHTKAGKDMQTAATASNEQPATQLDSKHQKLLDKLTAATGSDFDKTYVKEQVSAHKEAVSLFTTYAKSGDDSDLKAFANQTLPTLQEHKDHIEQLKKSL